MDTPAPTRPHSADYFGDYRDLWWNRDFLELMAQRLRLADVKLALDVGCGIGHWGHILASVMPAHCHFVGVDREREWVQKATERAQSSGLGARFRYQQGEVDALPFEDGIFDLVTCQTLLIHVAEPKRALSEMLRVLKPGGLILAVEPNNLAQTATLSSVCAAQSVESICDGFRFELTCQRGKAALGLGNSSLGDLVPGYLAELAVRDIAVHLSDKTSPSFPPYESDEQGVLIEQFRAWADSATGPEEREVHRKYFLAGGGSEAEFERLWKARSTDQQAFERALVQGAFHAAGGTMMYLCSGRKA